MGGNEDGRGLGERLAVDPHATYIVYFGSRHDGLQRSADQGRTWSRVTAFPTAGLGRPAPHQTHAGVSFVVFDPRGGSDNTPTHTLYAGVADPGQHHLFRSEDAGASWQPVPGEPRADLLPVRAQLAANGILYLTYSNGIGPNGITDGAVFALDTSNSTWHDITPPRSPSGPRGGFMGISLDARQSDTLLVATLDNWRSDTIWRSTDAGRHWESLRTRSEIDTSASPFLNWGEAQADFGWWIAGVAIDPFDSNHIAYTTGATLYTTDQPLAATEKPRILWRPWVKGIEETAILALASPPLGPPLLSGFGDIGGFAHEDLSISPPTMFAHPTFDNTDTIEFAGRAPNVVVRSGRSHHGELPIAAWSEDFGRSWTSLRLAAAKESGVDESVPSSNRGESAAVVVSADGATLIAMTPVPMLTRDRGEHWVAARGLPKFARVVADRVDARRFYAVDFGRPGIAVSNDGGETFAMLGSGGFPKDACVTQPARRDEAWPLLAAPGRVGDLWLVCGGGLYHSLDGGHQFTRRGGDLAVKALAFGKSRTEGGYPTLFAIGLRGDLEAIWRSEDAGASWVRINDAEHEYGRRFRVISADPRVFGRVYVGTDGRGVLFGEPAVKNRDQGTR
jgi:xyloglucan-specific exo-beta-1,4-glucanase